VIFVYSGRSMRSAGHQLRGHDHEFICFMSKLIGRTLSALDDGSGCRRRRGPSRVSVVFGALIVCDLCEPDPSKASRNGENEARIAECHGLRCRDILSASVRQYRHDIDSAYRPVDQQILRPEEQECWGQVDDQEAASVIGKALPHLGQERSEALRVSEKACIPPRRDPSLNGMSVTVASQLVAVCGGAIVARGQYLTMRGKGLKGNLWLMVRLQRRKACP